MLLSLPGIRKIINEKDGMDNTSFHLAIWGKNMVIIELLSNHPNLDINVASGDAWSHLRTPIWHEDLPVIEMILKHKGLEVNADALSLMKSKVDAFRVANKTLSEYRELSGEANDIANTFFNDSVKDYASWSNYYNKMRNNIK